MLRSALFAVPAVLALVASAACGGSAAPSNADNGPSSGSSSGGGGSSGGSGGGHGDAGNSGSSSSGSSSGGSSSSSGGDAGSTQGPTPMTEAKSLVVIGDSISHGGGEAPYYYDLLTSNDDAMYPEWSGKDLKTRYGAGLMVVNAAVPGAVSADLPGQVTGLPSSLPGPVIVTVTIGGNDMQQNIGAILTMSDQPMRDAFRANIASALGQLTKPGRFGDGVDVHVFEAEIYDPSGGTGNLAQCPPPLGYLPMMPFDPYFAPWNEVVDTEVPKHGSSFPSPMHALFHPHPVASSDSWFFSDCIHPNAKGHNAIRSMFWEEITGTAGPQPM